MGNPIDFPPPAINEKRKQALRDHRAADDHDYGNEDEVRVDFIGKSSDLIFACAGE